MMRIIDLSTDLAGRYATRLIADQGAEVIAVELSRDGAPLPPSVAAADLDLLSGHLDRNKTKLGADLASGEDRRALLNVLNGADFVVHGFPAALAGALGLGADEIRAAGAGALMTLTPYGYSNAEADLPATEKTLQAAGGAMLISGGAESLAAGQPPLDLNVPFVSTMGGILGAMSLLAHRIGVRRESAPAFAHLDLALRDVVPAGLEKLIASYTYLNVCSLRGTRGGRMQSSAGFGDMRAKDGYFHVFVLREAYKKLAELIGRADLAADPNWSDPRRRTYTTEETAAITEAAIAKLSLGELAERAADLKMPSGPVVEIDRLAERAQLKHRGALRISGRTVEIEEPYRFLNAERARKPVLQAAGLADLRAPSQDTAPPQPKSDPRLGPLRGVRVLDLTQAYAGPSATRILGELGAEVIKIESVGRLDIYPRALIPFANDTSGDFWERTGYFAERNLNKKGVTLDLSEESGREIFRRLLPLADVVASNYTPRVMPRWGFGPEALLEINPRLVVLSMSGFGLTGPDNEMPALAGLIEAASGFTAQVRYGDDEAPRDVGFSFGDMVSGLYGALATLIALERRDRTGRGEAIDLSCAEAPLPFLAAGITEWARTGRAPSVAREIVPGGRHLFLRCGAEHERWVIVYEPREREGTVAALFAAAETVSAGRPRIDLPTWFPHNVLERLRGAGLACATLADAGQLFESSVLRERRLFDVVERAEIGSLPHARVFPTLANGAPMGVGLSPPPRLGEHNLSVLSELAALSAAELEALAASGLIGEAPTAPVQSVLRTPVPLDELVVAGRVSAPTGVAARLAELFGYAVKPRPAGAL